MIRKRKALSASEISFEVVCSKGRKESGGVSCIFVGDLSVRPWKRSEALVVPHKNFEIVVLVAYGNIWFHDVEAAAIDGIDELISGSIENLPIHSEEKAYRNAERPDIRRCSPRQLHCGFGTPEDRGADVVSIFGVSGLLADGRSKIRKLHLGDPLLRVIRIIDEHVVGLYI
jgi:hypothetical protein